MYNPGLEQLERPQPTRMQQLRAYAQQHITFANLVGFFGAILGILCLFGIPDTQYWNIRIPLYLIVIVWTLLRPRMALYLLPFAIPWGTADPVQFGGANSADVLVVLLGVGWSLSFVLRPYLPARMRRTGIMDHDNINTPRYVIVALSFLLLMMLLSMLVATSISTSAKEIVKWVEVGIVLIIGSQYIRTRRQIWTLVVLLCIAAMTQAGYGYTQEFFDLGPSSFIRADTLRVYGTFGQPNPYAGYINMILTITLALLLLGRTLKTRLLALIPALLLLGVEYLSESKGGWLALAVSLLFIVLVALPQLRFLLGFLGVGFIALVEILIIGLLPLSIFMPILTKIGVIGISFTAPTNDNYANSERVAHWFVGIQEFIHHPFLGVGIGNYANDYATYAPGIFVLPLGHAHNYLINIAAETGIFGFTAYVLFLLATFVAGGNIIRGLNQRYKQQKRQFQHPSFQQMPARIPSLQRQERIDQLNILSNDRALAIGLVAALISVFVHNLVDNLYVHSLPSLFALLLAMLIRLDKVK
ncbi:MAG TPA: O-antigen ligase family protein [Dictyobacter sp.]|jgi:O-antigen ligase|nr:O-antigen ligase family protein [Dictyobacter sp.]